MVELGPNQALVVRSGHVEPLTQSTDSHQGRIRSETLEMILSACARSQGHCNTEVGPNCSATHFVIVLIIITKILIDIS